MSLFVPSAGGLSLLARQLAGRYQQITSCTNASPLVATATAHGLSNGNCVNVAGATGLTNVNGTNLVVNNVTANTFQLASISGTSLTLLNGNGVFGGTCYFSLAGLENCYVKLFSNNHAPAEGDTAGNYTELPTAGGYTQPGLLITSSIAPISGANTWAVPATVSAGGTGGWAAALGSGSTNVPESVATTLVWNWSANVSAYGYVVVGATSGTIWWAELFSAIKNFSSGDQLSLNIRIGTTHG